jgi:ArsR family transcriptional regulator, arsenate/arsenite/antimonite-responsive transcriptional repressor
MHMKPASTLPVIPSTNVPSDVAQRGARLLKLLADPTRRRIFLMLLRGETCNCELAEGLAVGENLISHHIRQLREAGLVRERRDPADARWIHYTVDAEAYRAAWQAFADDLDPVRIETRSPICC